MDPKFRDVFFQETFNVDKCLSLLTQKSDLETLKRELRNYGNELQNQMSDILKSETEAIVNLAEYLTNLNEKVDNLLLPISQLKEEIKSLYEIIKSAEYEFNNMLTSLKLNNSKRLSINLKMELAETWLHIRNLLRSREEDIMADLSILEHIVSKYSFQKHYIEELGIEQENEKDEVEDKLIQLIDSWFLQAVKNNNEDTLVRTLRMYENLGQHQQAYKNYQLNLVKPALSSVISERYLEKFDYNIKFIYEKVQEFLNNDMTFLLNVIARHSDLHSYNFVLGSFWVEFDKQMREKLPNIAAPGNPEQFQSRFINTWSLLQEISRKAGDPNLIKTDETFQNHIKRFNLPVYFEIRFQQIAGNFETDLVKFKQELAEDNPKRFKLKTSNSLWTAMKQCFSSEVFIDQLSDQFVKLTMLLLSRYITWFVKIIQEGQSNIDYLSYAYIDLNLFKKLVGSENEAKEVYRPLPPELNDIIPKLCKNNANILTKAAKILQKYLVKVKVSDCVQHLEKVSAIPRLYRRTNRSSPKGPSGYVTDAVQIVSEFRDKHSKEDKFLSIIEEILTTITEKYLVQVQDVLKSVCKTQESLRRLKSRNIGSSDEPGSSDSDEIKIRDQIRFDVTHFVEKLYGLGEPEGRSKLVMDKLKQEIK